MSETEFSPLGAAEREIVKQLRGAIATAAKNARKLADGLEEIDLDGLDALMLDSKARDAAISMVGPLGDLGKNLAMNELAVVIATVVLRPRDEVRS